VFVATGRVVARRETLLDGRLPVGRRLTFTGFSAFSFRKSFAICATKLRSRRLRKFVSCPRVI
jgi:hypothetical protein